MWQEKERLQECGVEVVVITFADEEQALNYRLEMDVGWPMAVDRSRELYRYFGMTKAGRWDVWGPSTWLKYLQEIMRGNRPKFSGGDVYQRGGDVLIDPHGVVRLHHVGKGPGDRPEIDQVLALACP